MSISKTIKKHIDEFLEIYLELLKWQMSNKTGEFYLLNELIKARNNLMIDFIYHPGEMIYYENPHYRKTVEKAMEHLWNTFDSLEMAEEVTIGDTTDFMVGVIGDYMNRLVKLKPTLVSFKPRGSDFEIYYQEAVRCWLFGVNNSAIILCCSIIEDLLKTSLYKKDPSYVFEYGNGKGIKSIKQKPLDVLIKNAKSTELLNKELSNKAFGVKNYRNVIVHKLQEPITDESTLEVIMDTKTIIEALVG